jgi:hypothetical protein
MANKGLQFEHAVMYVAKSRIVARDTDDEKDFNDAASQWSSIPQDIKKTAEKIVLDFAPSGEDAKQKYFSSFRKMSGGEEPKTDILFVKGSQKYRCSMKWGKSFQLTSAGIDKSIQVFKKVLQKSIQECGMGSVTDKGLGYIQSIMEQIADKFENNTGTMDQPTAKRLLSDTKKSGGIAEQLEAVLGTRKNPDVSKAYHCFKKNLTRECMTGELLFGTNSDKTATHLFTENGIKPIDDKAVEEVMNQAGVRLALKGRGKDPSTGVRRNAIVIRYEV